MDVFSSLGGFHGRGDALGRGMLMRGERATEEQVQEIHYFR